MQEQARECKCESESRESALPHLHSLLHNIVFVEQTSQSALGKRALMHAANTQSAISQQLHS